MQRVAAVKHTFTVEDVYERASRTLEKCIRHGATRMRTHLELDGGVEMRSFEAIEALRRDYAWAIDVEVCVFPQEGLTDNPRSDALLVEGLKRGAKVIGAAPNYDPDHAGQIHRVFDLAREFDVDIDMHLNSGNSPDEMDIHLVCELTEKYRLGGRVAVGHMCKLSTMPLADLRALARRIADAGVAVTVLPATELFMMGRDQEYNVRRGVADVNLLVEHGVNCSLSTNNVLNPFTPFGDALAAADGESAGQRLPDQRAAAAARVLRHADRAVGTADEPEGLRDQGRQSRGYRGAGRDDAGAGGGGDLPPAGGVQARQRTVTRPRQNCTGQNDALRSAAASNLGDMRPFTRLLAAARNEMETTVSKLPRQRRQPHRLHDRRLHRSVATAGDASAAARRDGIVEALVCRGAAAVPPLSRGAHGPARPRRIAGAAAGTAAVDGPAGAGRARTARSSRIAAPVHVVGNSAGGYLAQNLAMASPERVRSLMLFGSTPGLKNSQAHTWLPRVAREGLRNFLAATIEDRFPHGHDRGHIEWFLDEAAKNDTAYIGRFVGLMTTLWWADELPRIKCPTLLVMPGAETVGSTQNYEIMRAKIPDCELITYEGLPHNICDIVPDRCAADILAFLRRRFP